MPSSKQHSLHKMHSFPHILRENVSFGMKKTVHLNKVISNKTGESFPVPKKGGVKDEKRRIGGGEKRREGG